MYPKMHVFVVERLELIKLDYLCVCGGGGGDGVPHCPNTPQYTGVLLCNCNLYKYLSFILHLCTCLYNFS